MSTLITKIFNRLKYALLIAFVVCIVLVIAGFIFPFENLFLTTKFDPATKKMEFASSFIYPIICLPFIFISCKEIVSLFDSNLSKHFWLNVGCLFITYYFYTLIQLFKLPLETYALLSIILVIFSYLCFFFIQTLICSYGNIQNKKQYLILISMFFIYWSSVFLITVLNGAITMLLLLFLSSANDTCAYFFGKFLGKHKLNIDSPNKTVEGFLYGIAAGAMLTTGVIAILQATGKYETGFSGFQLFFIFIFLIFFSLVSHLGDLFFSKQKRALGIKDFSQIFGPHGGFWDRFDSNCFVLMLMLIINLIYFLAK